MVEDQALSCVTRFAPSPTGPLHAGHAHAAAFAAALGTARFLLRIEDIDPARARAGHVAPIARDLRWLGLRWHGRARRQSRHLGEYQQTLGGLAARGLAYPCFCSRAEIARELALAAAAPHAGTPPYPGTCRGLVAAERDRRLAAGHPHAWRFDTAAALGTLRVPLRFHELGEGPVDCHPEAHGDIVLGRRDAPASYHLCVTHDDAISGVTLVTRAEDLRPATSIQRLLQAVLGWPEPRYAHHRLLCDPATGERLSKRAGAPSLAVLRAAGIDPRALTEPARAEARARNRQEGTRSG